MEVMSAGRRDTGGGALFTIVDFIEAANLFRQLWYF